MAFRSVTEPFDTSHAAGRAFMQIPGVFAELERENIRERSKMGIPRWSRRPTAGAGPQERPCGRGLSPQVIREQFGAPTLSSVVDRIRWIVHNPVYAGRHEAIIDPVTWFKLQDLIEQRQRTPNRSHTSRYPGLRLRVHNTAIITTVIPMFSIPGTRSMARRKARRMET